MFGQGGNVTKSHLIGAAVGVGATVAAFYLYKKNKSKVDGFLKAQGINIKTSDNTNYEDMSIETLTEIKEHIEDVIAEKQLDDVPVEQCDIVSEVK